MSRFTTRAAATHQPCRLHSPHRLLALLGAAGLLLGAHSSAHSQEFSRYLQCAGHLQADGKTESARLDLALSFNSRTALIQGSNLLPVGERMRYTPTPMAYTMTYLLRPKGVQALVVPGWFENTVLVKFPNLKRTNQIRLSINRSNGEMEGVVLNEEDQNLASFKMDCQSRSEAELEKPKF